MRKTPHIAAMRNRENDLEIRKQKARSPMITHLSWGRLEVGSLVFKDAKVFPGGAEVWDWRVTGTNHFDGICLGDVLELLERGAEVLVLSSGMLGKLALAPETEDLLNEKKIRFHRLKTEGAVRLFNKLAEKHQVGGLFHTTC